MPERMRLWIPPAPASERAQRYKRRCKIKEAIEIRAASEAILREWEEMYGAQGEVTPWKRNHKSICKLM